MCIFNNRPYITLQVPELAGLVGEVQVAAIEHAARTAGHGDSTTDTQKQVCVWWHHQHVRMYACLLSVRIKPVVSHMHTSDVLLYTLDIFMCSELQSSVSLGRATLIWHAIHHTKRDANCIFVL